MSLKARGGSTPLRRIRKSLEIGLPAGWHSEHPTLCSGDMTLQRMDNVLIVVDDLEAAKAFFAELGMELEGEITVEGPWVDQPSGSTASVPTTP